MELTKIQQTYLTLFKKGVRCSYKHSAGCVAAILKYWIRCFCWHQ